jgi:hypothetical protein
VLGDAGYQGVDKRNPNLKVNWHVAMRSGRRKALDLSSALARDIDHVEQIKASIRAKVEHPFRVVKQQFGLPRCATADWRRTARLTMLFAPSNLWMVRRQMSGAQGRVRLQCANGRAMRPQTGRRPPLKLGIRSWVLQAIPSGFPDRLGAP